LLIAKWWFPRAAWSVSAAGEAFGAEVIEFANVSAGLGDGVPGLLERLDETPGISREIAAGIIGTSAWI
jgi:hypothetical protein